MVLVPCDSERFCCGEFVEVVDEVLILALGGGPSAALLAEFPFRLGRPALRGLGAGDDPPDRAEGDGGDADDGQGGVRLPEVVGEGDCRCAGADGCGGDETGCHRLVGWAAFHPVPLPGYDLTPGPVVAVGLVCLALEPHDLGCVGDQHLPEERVRDTERVRHTIRGERRGVRQYRFG